MVIPMVRGYAEDIFLTITKPKFDPPSQSPRIPQASLRAPRDLGELLEGPEDARDRFQNSQKKKEDLKKCLTSGSLKTTTSDIEFIVYCFKHL